MKNAFKLTKLIEAGEWPWQKGLDGMPPAVEARKRKAWGSAKAKLENGMIIKIELGDPPPDREPIALTTTAARNDYARGYALGQGHRYRAEPHPIVDAFTLGYAEGLAALKNRLED